MKQRLLLAIGLALSPLALPAQEKPVIVVEVYTAAPGVEWPYDMKVMQSHTLSR